MTAWLAMLTFISPWWAASAVAAVGLPLLAHLLSRTRYRQVLFPATRFIQRAALETSRIEQPRHRLLMLLRWLLLLLVVIAFMRPLWLPEAQATNREQGIARIILIDTSASMQRTEAGATLYGRAARQAQTLMDQLDPSRDVAAVVQVGRTAKSLLPEPTANMQLLRDALSATQPTYETANWPAAIATAQRLAQATDRRLEVVILSDQQGDGPAPQSLVQALGPVPVKHIALEGPTTNTAIRLVDVQPYPAINNRTITITTELSHFGSSPRTVTLQASLSAARTKRTLTLNPGTKQRVELSIPANGQGLAVLRLSIDAGDALSFDDEAGLVIDIQNQTEALIVHDNNSSSTKLAERFAAVLNPKAVEGLSLPKVQTATLDLASQTLGQADAARLRTVILISAEPIDKPLSDTLSAYMRRGGGVIQIVRQVGAAADEKQSMQAPLIRTQDGDPLAVATPAWRIDFSLDALRVFEGPARAGLAGLVWPGVDPAQTADQALALLTGSDGRVIIAAQAIGRGRWVVINSDITPGPGGLLAQPSFVVLFNELCRYASPGPAMPAPARPGDAAFAIRTNAPRLVIPPGADKDSAHYTAPGAYLALNRSGELIDGRWVAIDPAESDTRAGNNWAVQTGVATNDFATQSSVSGQADLIARDKPVELWPYLVMFALLLAAVESALLWRFAGEKGGGA